MGWRVAYHKKRRLKGYMRENGFRSIGGLAQRLTVGLAKGRGAALMRLKADWSAVVGPDLARVCRPDAVIGGRSARTGKALRLRVSGAAALEVQHRSAQIVDRVNAYFGHRAVDEIKLVQGSIPAPPVPRLPPRIDPAVEQAMARRAEGVKDPDLRAALARLGANLTSGRRSVLVAGLGAFFVAGKGRAQALSAAKLMEVVPGDHVLGKPDAPNILIDYASFTCPHCANFNAAVMPVLRREWIETGRMRVVHRHFPSDGLATRASLLAECAGPEKFFAAVDTLFRTQVQWMTAPDPTTELLSVLRDEGVTEESAAACVANDQLLDKVISDVQSGQTLGVRATPNLFINEENYGNPGSAEAIAQILRQVGR